MHKNMWDILIDVKQAIINRRAYRSLEPVDITVKLIYDFADNHGDDIGVKVEEKAREHKVVYKE